VATIGYTQSAPRLEQSRQQTAKNALQVLLTAGRGYVVPTPKQSRNLRVAFASAGKVLYGRAYDAVRIPANLDLNDFADIESRLEEILICEIKSTAKGDVGPRFRGFFFSLSTAELLVAQNLGSQFRFVFVNTRTREIEETDLVGVYKKVRAIYPTWSIQF
jgi:hypothetical protein